ncbi:MAG: biosynthetic arginine decarboxylase [Thermoanaerobaculales bacterium]|jgi:arginine decarboxylase|nr:biosynthetic arginine decarboxylase [Thermoanaerobaculales bacterium]
MTTTNNPQAEPAVAREGWSPAASAELYRIDEWGMGFFSVGENGHLMVNLDGNPDHMIDLHEVVLGLEERGISVPVNIGFPDLLAARMREMASAFSTAIAENGYRGSYTAVYPIKVNQHRSLVRKIEVYGREHGFGLEVGSKPELLAVMGLTVDHPDRLIICNGFKEERYLNHIMLATKLGRHVVAVVESLAELELLLDAARAYSVRPRVGVRLKLDALASGRWQGSTGEKAKFGLSIPGVLDVVGLLRQAGMLDCLELLHCHMGSQLSDIQVINSGLQELTRVYADLNKMGANLSYLDVGGGIGVDYDGSQTNWDFSANYGLEEYAATVVYRIMAVCDEAGVAHPTIVTEAGRAMVCHHSVLVSNVLGVSRLDRHALTDEQATAELAQGKHPRIVRDVLEALLSVRPDHLLESYHDALQARQEALTRFSVGLISLEQRGLVDRVFWSTCIRISALARDLDPIPEELLELEQKLSDTYFCNLSVFQSLPDSWAIDQVFPIMPIHRLDEEPVRRATLADITCDSDGKIDRFIQHEDVATVLPLHQVRDGEPYYIAVFLVGAYQETLGDLHNLFGDTNLVHIRYDDDEGWYVDEVVDGDTIGEVLGYLQYDVRELSGAIRRDCESSVRAKRLTAAESRTLLAAYDAGLTGYTYLESS